MKNLSHFDEEGKIRMVDVSDKSKTFRAASASAKVFLNSATLDAIADQTNPKGNPLEIARIAGVLGAKKTSALIPLCHQLDLSGIDIVAEPADFGVLLVADVKTKAETGVEMEALTAVTIAALTIYDMCKAVQKDIQIGEVRLESKTGGANDYKRIPT